MEAIVNKSQYQDYTYQHIQGCMHLKLNQKSLELKLDDIEYRLMSILIGLYNKKLKKAFPSKKYLAQCIDKSESTVTRRLKNLVNKNLLIVVKTPGKKNSYYFSNILLGETPTNITHDTPTPITCDTPTPVTCDTTMITNRDLTKREQTSCKKNIKTQNKSITNKNDDVSLKTQSISEYKQVLNILDTWRVSGAKNLIKKYGTQKIKKLIDITQERKPDNAGAYLRSLLALPYQNIPDAKNVCCKSPEEPLINQMIKHKFWRHKPTGKILQAKPDVGTHLLIKYWKDENLVQFIDHDFADKLENFEGIDIVDKTN